MIDLPVVSTESWLVRPALEVAGLGLVEGRGHLVNNGVDVGSGEGPGSELKITVDILLPEVLVRKEAVPPRKGEVIRSSGPRGGIVVPAIRRIHRPVEVPDRTILDLPSPLFVEVGAQAECIRIQGKNIEEVMIDPGIDVNIAGIPGDRVSVVWRFEGRIHGVDVVPNPRGL